MLNEVTRDQDAINMAVKSFHRVFGVLKDEFDEIIRGVPAVHAFSCAVADGAS